MNSVEIANELKELLKGENIKVQLISTTISGKSNIIAVKQF